MAKIANKQKVATATEATTVEIKVKKLSVDATLPTKAYEHDACWDLYSSEKKRLPTNEVVAIKTDIAVAIPEGYFGLILERSGFSLQNGLKLKAGVIDSGYRGEVKIVFQCLQESPYDLQKGDKIAQLAILPVINSTLTEVEDLNATERGDKGFGSSDKE